MKFSARTNWNTEESALARAHRERLSAGLAVADLTASNPTRCGFHYPANLLEALTDPKAFDYDPNPLGSLFAREAVCRYYASHGTEANPGAILLTTSTSEAYGYLFKLFCNPGDTLIAPQPSYPLFDFLADAEVVQLVSASFVYDHGWQLDMESLRRRITSETRAVVLVHPNNPTGHFTGVAESKELAALCREHDLALIVDEVFLDYALSKATKNASFAARELDCLVCIVSGISKICGLPQMKAAWLMVTGPGSEEAMARLEVLADTYLSVNAPVQRALSVWLERRFDIQRQIQCRVEANLEELDRLLAAQPEPLVNRLEVEGGWYAVLRVPAWQRDESTALDLLGHGVWIHPGSFFGFSNSGWLVISLLTKGEGFSAGVPLLLEYFRKFQESY